MLTPEQTIETPTLSVLIGRVVVAMVLSEVNTVLNRSAFVQPALSTIIVSCINVNKLITNLQSKLTVVTGNSQ